MKNPELFHKTISILVKAYQKDTLQHGDCTMCAVGNLIAATGKHVYPGGWADIFVLDDSRLHPSVIEKLESTGYSISDIRTIERAFETKSPIMPDNWGTLIDELIFDGLMAVVDALMIIHEATKEEAEEAKLLFVK